MNHPFTLWILVIFSAAIQGLLWYSELYFVEWLNVNAILWLAIAGFSAAGIFLLIYRWIATIIPAWNFGLIFASLLQFAALANSAYFIWRVVQNIYQA